jgi:hypothetical protein
MPALAINKSYIFGAYNKTPWDTTSALECTFLKPEDVERDERGIFAALRADPGLMHRLRCANLKLKAPDESRIQMIQGDVSVSDDCQWRTKLGAIRQDQHPDFPIDQSWSGQDKTFSIGHHSFRRFVVNAKSASDRHFNLLLVQHYAVNGGKRDQVVGRLLFLFTPFQQPNLDPFRK